MQVRGRMVGERGEVLLGEEDGGACGGGDTPLPCLAVRLGCVGGGWWSV